MWLIYTSKHVPQDWISSTFPGENVIRSVPLVYKGILTDEEKECSGVSKVVAIGSGRVIDYAKLVASVHDKPLIAVPTSITTDCLFTDVTALRRGRGVEYVKSKVPDELMLVPSMLMKNVGRCNYAWMDLLSSFTATIGIEDCIGDEQRTFNKVLRDFTVSNIGWIKDFSDVLRLLFCLSREVGICEAVGTALGVEEGLEHYMSYMLEDKLGERYMHGEYLHATTCYLRDKYKVNMPMLSLGELNYKYMKSVLEKIEPKALEWLREDVKKVGIE